MNELLVERLKKARAEIGLKQQEVANRLGVKANTISNWEKGRTEPDIDSFVSLCDIYKIDCASLLSDVYAFKRIGDDISLLEYEHIKKYRNLDDFGRETVATILARETKRVEDSHAKQQQLSEQQEHIDQLEQRIVTELVHRIAVPLYDKFASAGSGAYLFDDIPTDMIEVEDTPTARKADFVIGVNGNSMEPDFYDGDKVFIKKTSDLNIGDIGIFLKGENCYIKELGVDRLISHNPDKDRYPDVQADEDVRLIGKVIGKVERDI